MQGFPQEEYEQLLELSAYFLQGTQAAALAAVLATADGDAGLARHAALVSALLAPWTISYRMGLLDGRADRALPTVIPDPRHGRAGHDPVGVNCVGVRARADRGRR